MGLMNGPEPELHKLYPKGSLVNILSMSAKMASALKRRKVDFSKSQRNTPSSGEKKDIAATAINRLTKVDAGDHRANILRIQQAKNYAVSQAQQDGSKGNFKIFDSPFGNFLVPVIPSRAELVG